MSERNCIVIRPGGHAHHHLGDESSSCFYNEAFDLSSQASALATAGEKFVAWTGRIEVKDDDSTGLHQHPGTTIALITAGSGIFKMVEDGEIVDVRVNHGDLIIVPPNTPHLSIADPDTTMIEHITYLGAESDRQTSI